jgi:uncharacterized protein YjbJ (UPF0337 family)
VIGSSSSARSRKSGASSLDDDIAAINGKREQLEGKIQERYGHTKDQVKKDVDDWHGSLK